MSITHYLTLLAIDSIHGYFKNVAALTLTVNIEIQK